VPAGIYIVSSAELFCVLHRFGAARSIFYAIGGAKVEYLISEVDRRILRELHRDSSRTVTEIADAVGLSHAPCWRRIQRLRSAGYVVREAAVLDRSKLGWELEFFIYIKFSMTGRGNVPEFRRRMIAHDRVIGAYIILGNFDLMLHVLARSMQDYQEFYLEHLSGQPNIGDITSMTVMSVLKEAQVPV
jgi:Lrp/AsnC family transcriptional regulator